MEAYEEAISATSTAYAPWYIVPADHKWVSRAVMADILTTTIQSLNLRFPKVSEKKLEKLGTARQQLENEK